MKKTICTAMAVMCLMFFGGIMNADVTHASTLENTPRCSKCQAKLTAHGAHLSDWITYHTVEGKPCQINGSLDQTSWTCPTHGTVVETRKTTENHSLRECPNYPHISY